MPDPWNDSELVQRFRTHAETAFARAPLNAALCAIIAKHGSLSGLLAHAPLPQQLPVLLLAAIHFLVLDEPGAPLAQWYPNLTAEPLDPKDASLEPALRAFCEDRAHAILDLVASRRVQTNEIGRTALFLPAFSSIAREVGPVAHVDIGTSAGLNTLMQHYSFRYDDRPPIGTAAGLASGIDIGCATRGVGAIPEAMPDIAAAIGVDSEPIDVADPTEARWLEACCWPDQADRFRRLHAAIAVARRHRPDVRVGDAVETIGATIDEAANRGHPVLTTSWVMNYLSPAGRTSFIAQVERVGRRCDVSWVIAEAPALTPELPRNADLSGDHRDHLTALTLVRWRSGVRTITDLGTCHPHGYWIHWR